MAADQFTYQLTGQQIIPGAAITAPAITAGTITAASIVGATIDATSTLSGTTIRGGVIEATSSLVGPIAITDDSNGAPLGAIGGHDGIIFVGQNPWLEILATPLSIYGTPVAIHGDLTLGGSIKPGAFGSATSDDGVFIQDAGASSPAWKIWYDASTSRGAHGALMIDNGTTQHYVSLTA